MANRRKFLTLSKAAKILIAVILLFLSAGLFFYGVVINNRTNITLGNDGRMYAEFYVAAILIAIVITMFFPKNIKTWKPIKKILFGIISGIILMIIIFAFFILWAFLRK
jgi:hypothetical protein